MYPWTILCLTLFITGSIHSSLLPRETETRDVRNLNGVWSFWLNDDSNVIQMPVPASYNDITTNKTIRDYVGVVWYERIFYVPPSWKDYSVFIRFGSVCYSATVYINDVEVFQHTIGHLPFEFEVSSVLNYGDKNIIRVSVDNTLSDETVPQGGVIERTIGNTTYKYHSYTFDFFHYAGIDRPVLLYTKPKSVQIQDITITTDLMDGDGGIVNYSVEVSVPVDAVTINLLNKDGDIVASADSLAGKLNVSNPILWWPYLMNPNYGYMYTFEVNVRKDESQDVYRLPIGIRSLTWTNSSLLINNKAIYIRGFGRHEDSDIRGKGLDLSVVVRDYNLLHWIGANTYRTSHYPYADEIMDLADENGIMIIDECPSVNAGKYLDNPALLQNHISSVTQLIDRDKNHPSVIMWSAANEPGSSAAGAGEYFRLVIDAIKENDPTRPVTIAMSASATADLAGQYLDIIGFNRYNAWYSDTGKTEVIFDSVIEEAEAWYNKHKKPVLMTEYGADTYPGLHTLPETVWTEDYQVETMSQHFKAFDKLRESGHFIGEMIWNFADFNTQQTTTRVDGNKKGVFTRTRQPKAVAHLVRQRYYSLAEELDNVANTCS